MDGVCTGRVESVRHRCERGVPYPPSSHSPYTVQLVIAAPTGRDAVSVKVTGTPT